MNIYSAYNSVMSWSDFSLVSSEKLDDLIEVRNGKYLWPKRRKCSYTQWSGHFKRFYGRYSVTDLNCGQVFLFPSTPPCSALPPPPLVGREGEKTAGSLTAGPVVSGQGALQRSGCWHPHRCWCQATRVIGLKAHWAGVDQGLHLSIGPCHCQGPAGKQGWGSMPTSWEL